MLGEALRDCKMMRTCYPFGEPLRVRVPERCPVCDAPLRYEIPLWSSALYIYHNHSHLPPKNAVEVIDTDGGIVYVWLEKWHRKEGE
jgi:hypothetical protein